MAKISISMPKVLKNISALSDFFKEKDIHWTLITKVLGGNEEILRGLIDSQEINGVHSIGESRLSGLKMIKSINPAIRTMYIKPPVLQDAEEIVEYADISLNSSFDTIKLLDKYAREQDKIHQIIIMIEMGELREGVIQENVVDFYRQCFELNNIEIIGIGTNLGCMYGIEPTYDKLIQLSLYKQLLEAKFDRKLELISGGTSITLPLEQKGKTPTNLNHYRVGEAAFLGVSPLDGEKFDDLNTDAFEVSAAIVEIEEKSYEPDGVIGEGNVGHTAMNIPEGRETSFKAIVDFGIMDVDYENILTNDEEVNFIGTTSDLTVYDIGENCNPDGSPRYKVGDFLNFNTNYMGVARLMHSKYVEKEIV